MSIHTDSNYNLVIFCSGTGSNLKAIHSSIKSNILLASIEIVIINNKHAPVIDYCIENNIHYMILEWNKEQHSREKYYELIIKILSKINIDLIVLAGWMNICTTNLINTYKNIINIHPALLPKYGGKGMYGMHVQEAVVANREVETGITIHYVNENYDEGAQIFQKKVTVLGTDTPEVVSEKIHSLEQKYFPIVIEDLLK